MTSEEIEQIKKRLISGWDMTMLASEKIGKEKKEWSLCDVMKSADIIKDLTKSFKNLVEVESIISESGIEKY
jgi:hypothetical protein